MTTAERNAAYLQQHYDLGHTELPEPLRFDNLGDISELEPQGAPQWAGVLFALALILIAALVWWLA